MAFEDLRNFRIQKLLKLRERNIDPYPSTSARDFAQKEILETFSKFTKKKKDIGLAGRLMAIRAHGGVIFGDLDDGTGKIQILLRKDKIGEKDFALFEETIDIGDFLQIKGRALLTKKKEKTIEAKEWKILAKSLRPLPEKWHGLQDVEERFRKRYLDLLMNQEVRGTFQLRSRLIRELRNILDKEDFTEVETPILQPLYGGALAEPFKTHHRMLNIDMYLRIAPEIYLKKLIVGGLNKIYEIGRVFRNEGIDASHNPEFTMLELYQTYRNSEYIRNFIAETLFTLIKKLTNGNQIQYDGNTIKFIKKIPSIPFWSIIERHALITHPEKLSREDFALKAKQFGLNPEEGDSIEKIADEIFKKVCRPKLIQPVFVINHPIAISPLSKQFPDNPELVDRFQLIVAGVELVNGFSELNDPEEQRKRFEYQENLRKGKAKETHPTDEDFIEALEYGMPPTAGLGMGIDRLTMLLTDTHNIKEVILFPTLKPKE